MYIFTPQEIRLIHEERVGQLTKDATNDRKQKPAVISPFKRALNALKRNDISE